MRSRLPLALLLPLALACELKDADSGTDASDGSQGSTADATAASDPLTTTADPSAATTTATTATTATTMATTATTDATTDATTSTTSASGPTSDTDTTADPSATTGGVDADEGATQLCVDTINMYRATLGLPALARWTEAEDCADAECLSDGMTGMAHGAFGMCGESAQNECPGWPGEPASMITGCLELMWNEGPGEDFQKHGHYINMSNPNYSRVACGFAPGMGGVWSVQNFQ